MENSLHIAEPLPAVRPKGAHRFEVFRPKLARRLTFFRRALVDEWIVLDEDEIAEAAQSIDAPLTFNFVDGKAPPLTAAQFERLGVKLLSFPASSTLAYARDRTAGLTSFFLRPMVNRACDASGTIPAMCSASAISGTCGSSV